MGSVMRRWCCHSLCCRRCCCSVRLLILLIVVFVFLRGPCLAELPPCAGAVCAQHAAGAKFLSLTCACFGLQSCLGTQLSSCCPLSASTAGCEDFRPLRLMCFDFNGLDLLMCCLLRFF